MAKRPKPKGGNQKIGGLTQLERRSVEMFLGPAEGNASRAYEMAGGGGIRSTPESIRKGASLLFQRPHVQAALERRSREEAMRDPRVLDADEVRLQLSFMAMGLGPDGLPPGEKDPAIEPKDRNYALDKLAKCYGLYLTKVHVEGQVDVVHQMADRVAETLRRKRERERQLTADIADIVDAVIEDEEDEE